MKTSEATMLDMIDGMNTDVMNATESLAADFTPEAMDSQNELGEAITNLWVAHANAKIAARATKDELRVLRANLGQQLSEMKKLLAKPGRAGQWSSFLEERQIPRATADRLVARHQRSLNSDANRLTEPITEPTEEEVQKLFTSVWPKFRRTLRSRQSLAVFIDLLNSHHERGEAAALKIHGLTPPAATICPASPDGDFFVEPEVGSTLRPGLDHDN
jgi:hypothetical protein